MLGRDGIITPPRLVRELLSLQQFMFIHPWKNTYQSEGVKIGSPTYSAPSGDSPRGGASDPSSRSACLHQELAETVCYGPVIPRECSFCRGTPSPPPHPRKNKGLLPQPMSLDSTLVMLGRQPNHCRADCCRTHPEIRTYRYSEPRKVYVMRKVNGQLQRSKMVFWKDKREAWTCPSPESFHIERVESVSALRHCSYDSEASSWW